MIWAQSCVCFLVWIGYGWWLKGRADSWLAKVRPWPVRRRGMVGSMGLVLGGLLVVSALFAVASMGGIQDVSLTLWAWPVLTAVGLAFVHLQSFAAVCLVSSALGRETDAQRGPSGQ